MSKNRSVTETVAQTVETVTPVAPKKGNAVNPNSIRQMVCTALLNGETTEQITEKIKAAHPNSAAAAKSVKHIAWYRADLRKRGLLAKPNAAVPAQS